MLRKLFVLSVVLSVIAAVSPVRAGGVLDVDADEESYVYLDGVELGTTPLKIRDVEPGYHDVRVENVRTGQRRDFTFYSPRRLTIEKDYRVDFAAEAPHGYVGGEIRHELPARDVVVVQDAPLPPEPKKDNTKVRMRNVFLGAALANEVFNEGNKSKKTIRKGAVGAALLNELLNR